MINIKLNFVLVLILLVLGCTPQQRIKKAKNKVFNLNDRFPSISKIDTINLKLKGVAKPQTYNIGKTYKLPEWVVNYNLKNKNIDTLPVIKIEKLEKQKGKDQEYKLQIECPPQDCEIEYRYLDRTIVGECDCNYEVNQATKQLKKDRFWLLLSTILGFTLSGVFAFAWVRKS
jgi:hypothetical protein